MKLKEKFDLIDQSKLKADQKDFLAKIEKATKNFTSDNKEVNDKVEGALDKMIATFKEKMPEVIKTTAKKNEPKATVKKSTSKKEAPKQSETKSPKRTVMTVAKEIRKEGESWADAQKRARAEINKDKQSANKEVKTEMDKLLAFIKTRKELEGIHGTDLKRDSVREALPRGRRISKDGNVYYENRENRIDRLAPNYPKDAPMLAKGGGVGEKLYYEIMNVGKSKYTVSYHDGVKTHKDGSDFYDIAIFKNKKDLENFISKLSKEGYKKRTSFYENGGYVAVTETKDDYWIIVSKPSSKKMAEEMAELVTTLKGEKNKVVTLAQAKAHKKVLGKEYLDKFEAGGDVDGYDLAGHLGGDFNVGQNDADLSGNTGTQYSGLVGETGAMSSGEMFSGGGSVKNERRHVNHSQKYEVRYAKNHPNSKRHGYGGVKYAEGGRLDVHGLKEGDQIIKTLSGGIQKIKDKNGQIFYVDLANGERSVDIPLPFDDGGKVPEFIVNKDGIRVSKMVEPKKKLSEKEWMAKHNESKEARAYKYGGKLDNYSEFIQYEFPKAKREANKYSKKYKVPYVVVVEKNNQDRIEIRTLDGFLDYPKSYQEAYDVLYETTIDYEHGGNIETNIKSRLAKNFSLPLEVAVYVPSTKDADEVISQKEFKNRITSVQKYLSDLFGGFSSNEVDGGYMSQEKGLITEEVYKVISFAQKDNFSAKMKKLVGKIKQWAKDWGQESIGLEFEGDLFYIDQKGNYAEGGQINAFSMRLVKGSNAKPDEVLTESQEVKFAKGGSVDSKRFDLYGYKKASNRVQDLDTIIQANSYEEAEKNAKKYLLDYNLELVELYRKNDFVGSIKPKGQFVYSSKYKKEEYAGGSTKRGGAMQLAKTIRKDGEKWTDAVKRASQIIKNK